MKKILLVFFITTIAFIAVAQKQVITMSGDTILHEVEGLYGRTLNFKGTRIKVDVSEVKEVFGETPFLRLNQMLKRNNDIIVHDRSLFSDINHEKNREIFNKPKLDLHPSGTHLKNAGACYLTATGLSIAGLIVLKVNVKEDSKALNNTAIVLGVAAGVSSIIGHIKLVQAGKSFTRESITLSPAKSGLGLAINF